MNAAHKTETGGYFHDEDGFRFVVRSYPVGRRKRLWRFDFDPNCALASVCIVGFPTRLQAVAEARRQIEEYLRAH